LHVLEYIRNVALRQIGEVSQLLALLRVECEEGLRTLLVLEEDFERLGGVEDRVEGLREAALHHAVKDTLARCDGREVCGRVDLLADLA